jgi:S1/P1 Nuclease
MWRAALATLIAVVTTSVSTEALAWGGRGHRIVAAIAMLLIPEKAAQMNTILGQLEKDNNFVDAASYPDEFIRAETHTFDTWHFADLPDGGQTFVCGECLFKALSENLAIIKSGKKDKSGAVAIAWVIHLVGDLHQPLHMSGRLRGGNEFHVTYRGKTECKTFQGIEAKVELHSAWDDCLVEELANGRDPKEVGKQILGNITTYKGRSEIKPDNAEPWLTWATTRTRSRTRSHSIVFRTRPTSRTATLRGTARRSTSFSVSF